MEYYKRLFNDIYAPDRPKARTGTFYHRWFGPFNNDRYRVVSSFVGRGDELLDLGCLDGDLIFMLEGRFKRFVGVDIVEGRLEKARRIAGRLGVRAEFALHDLNGGPLPFEDGRFDAVACVAVLQYIFDPAGLLREAARVLRPGGRFVFQVPNPWYLPRRLIYLAGRLPPQIFDPGVVQVFNRARCIGLAEGAGLRVETVTGSGLFASARNWYPGLLTGDLILKTGKILLTDDT